MLGTHIPTRFKAALQNQSTDAREIDRGLGIGGVRRCFAGRSEQSEIIEALDSGFVHHRPSEIEHGSGEAVRKRPWPWRGRSRALRCKQTRHRGIAQRRSKRDGATPPGLFLREHRHSLFAPLDAFAVRIALQAMSAHLRNALPRRFRRASRFDVEFFGSATRRCVRKFCRRSVP